MLTSTSLEDSSWQQCATEEMVTDNLTSALPHQHSWTIRWSLYISKHLHRGDVWLENEHQGLLSLCVFSDVYKCRICWPEILKIEYTNMCLLIYYWVVRSRYKGKWENTWIDYGSVLHYGSDSEVLGLALVISLNTRTGFPISTSLLCVCVLFGKQRQTQIGGRKGQEII